MGVASYNLTSFPPGQERGSVRSTVSWGCPPGSGVGFAAKRYTYVKRSSARNAQSGKA